MRSTTSVAGRPRNAIPVSYVRPTGEGQSRGKAGWRPSLLWCLFLVATAWTAVLIGPPGSAYGQATSGSPSAAGGQARLQAGLAQARFQEGLRLLGSRDLVAALLAFEAVLEADPANVFAQYNIGLIHVQFGRMDEATRSLHAALRLKPDLLIAYLHLGQIAEGRGDSEAAQDAYLAILTQAKDRQGAESRTASALLEALEDRLELRAALEQGDARLKIGRAHV